MADGFDAAAFCAGYRPQIQEAEICRRGDLYVEHARLDRELDAVRGDPARERELAERIVAVEAEIAAAMQTFTFEGVDDDAWADLLRDHAPTEAQLERAPGLTYNPETFPTAAIAASSVSPRLAPADVALLKAKLRQADFDALWKATADANVEVAAAPKSPMAAVVLRTNGASSTTSAPGVSPGGSGSAASDSPSPPTSTTTTAA